MVRQILRALPAAVLVVACGGGGGGGNFYDFGRDTPPSPRETPPTSREAVALSRDSATNNDHEPTGSARENPNGSGSSSSGSSSNNGSPSPDVDASTKAANCPVCGTYACTATGGDAGSETGTLDLVAGANNSCSDSTFDVTLSCGNVAASGGVTGTWISSGASGFFATIGGATYACTPSK